jgi:hypothetical protein
MTRRAISAVKGPSYLSTHLRLAPCRAQPGAHGAGTLPPGQCRGRCLAQRAGLARLLLPDPAPPSACGGAQLQARLRRHRLGNRAQAQAHLPPGARAAPATPGGRGHAPNPAHGLHAQPPAHGGGEFSDQGPGHRLALGRALLRSTSTTSTWRRTMVAGSGPAPVAAMHSPISASSTRSRRAAASIRRDASSAAICPGWPRCPMPHCMPPGKHPPGTAGCGRGAGARLPPPIVDHATARERT